MATSKPMRFFAGDPARFARVPPGGMLWSAPRSCGTTGVGRPRDAPYRGALDWRSAPAVSHEHLRRHVRRVRVAASTRTPPAAGHAPRSVSSRRSATRGSSGAVRGLVGLLRVAATDLFRLPVTL